MQDYRAASSIALVFKDYDYGSIGLIKHCRIADR